MPSVQDLIEELQSLSTLLSERVRAISIGVLALVWVFLAGGSNSPALPARPDGHGLLASGAFALCSLTLDYLQYVAGYLGTGAVLRKLEANAGKQTEFDKSTPLYRVRGLFFWLKQLAMVTALGFLAVAVLRALL